MQSWIQFSVVAGWQCVVKTVWHSVATHGVPAIAERFVVRDFIALADDVCEQAHVVVAVHGCAAGVQNVAAPSDDAPPWCGKCKRSSGLVQCGNMPWQRRLAANAPVCHNSCAVGEHEIRVVPQHKHGGPLWPAANQAPGAEIAMQSLVRGRRPRPQQLNGKRRVLSGVENAHECECMLHDVAHGVFATCHRPVRTFVRGPGLKDWHNVTVQPSAAFFECCRAGARQSGRSKRSGEPGTKHVLFVAAAPDLPSSRSNKIFSGTASTNTCTNACSQSCIGFKIPAAGSGMPGPGVFTTPCDCTNHCGVSSAVSSALATQRSFFSVSMSTTLPCSPLLFSVTKLFTSIFSSPFFQFKLPQRSRALPAPGHGCKGKGGRKQWRLGI